MKKRLVLSFLAVAVLAAVGGGGYLAYTNLFANPEPVDAPQPVPAPKVSMGPIHPMDPFLVNLSDPGRPRFLKVVVQLELDSDVVAPELDALKPKVRDAMLTLLSSKRSEDLGTVADKERLRNEVIHRLNSFLSAGKVVEAYFIEFVIQ